MPTVTTLGDVQSYLDSAEARLDQSSARVASGNRVICLGDQQALNGFTGMRGFRVPGAVAAQSWLGWASLLSAGRIRLAGQAATAASTIAQQSSLVAADGTTNLGRVLGDKPAACVVLVGTNDIAASAALSSMQASLTYLWGQLLSAGIMPVLCTVPPRNGDSTALRTLLTQLNAWICRYAEQQGLPFVDFYSVLVDPATGDYLSGLNANVTDPGGLGAKAMGQLLCDRLVGTNLASGQPGLSSEVLPPWSPPLAWSNVDASSVVQSGNKLNLVDTNADGVADGWTAGGAGATNALVADAANVKGNYQQVTRAAADAQVASAFGPIVGGHVVQVAAKVACTVKASAAQAHFRFRTNTNEELFSINAFTEDIPNGAVFAGEVLVPATYSPFIGVTAIVAVASGGAVRIGQLQVHDLTALGMV